MTIFSFRMLLTAGRISKDESSTFLADREGLLRRDGDADDP